MCRRSLLIFFALCAMAAIVLEQNPMVPSSMAAHYQDQLRPQLRSEVVRRPGHLRLKSTTTCLAFL
jgi:hypothetical protein